MGDTLYAADVESGAFEAGKSLVGAAAAPVRFGNPKLLVAIPSMRHARSHAMVHRWLDEWVIRNYGAATIHLALVASGRIDAALLTNSKLWDIAAGWVLVKQAGGEMTTPEGRPIFPIAVGSYEGEEMPALAASAAAHARLVVPI
jgi:myo-inositol-1(or 4)-monophosphatase